MYPAGEKQNLKYNHYDFAKLILKLSNTRVIIIKNNDDIEKYFRANLTKNEIIIGMGAGILSKYKEIEISFINMKQDLIKKFSKNIFSDVKLSKYSWFNLGGPAELFFKPEDKKQLIEFLKDMKKSDLNITILDWF